MSVHEREVYVDGLKVHYWEAGEGNPRTLLLIHGGMGDAKLHWEAALPILGETFHVLAPDLPGFSTSEVLPVARTDVLLHWLKSFIDVHEREQVVPVGNAFGALLARLFAAANPKYVPAVILINGGGVPDLPPFFKWVERIPFINKLVFSQFGKMGTSPDALNRLIHIKPILTEEFYAQSKASAPAFSQLIKMLVGSGVPAEQTPRVPTLVLWGVEDSFTAPGDRDAIKASIPGATITEIADCGHMPQLEAPDVFAWQVTTFLDKLSRPPSATTSGPKMLRKLSG
ncbi:MAG: alpha/beta hydrolase [Chloroflexi bacterium]|nr:alpha/beta hydrolase [Chloroflexota bacterium]MCC6893732.1 alpha/beta hydrolase [Anaerolineae bacterium]